MKRVCFFLVALLVSVATQAAEKLPKKVQKARAAVASILTYNAGVLKNSGTAVPVGDSGDILVPYSLMLGADSAVVIDIKGKVRPVLGIVGLDNLYDCVKVRVSADKKFLSLPLAASAVSVGEELYMLTYGKKNSGETQKVRVSAVDSLYSHAYYTLDVKMQDSYETLPLVNAAGELVALVQPAATGDTCCYAVSATISSSLAATSVTFGRGYYQGMGLRTLLPGKKEEALSCMYMQAVLGDSLSYRSVVDDFIAAYPSSHEGYLSRAEYMAVYCRNFDEADAEWEKALSLAEKPSEVHFSKAKTLYPIVQSGDTVSHSMLSVENVLSLLSTAIAADTLPLYVGYKADVLLAERKYEDAYRCYISLLDTEMRSAEVFSKASQCQGALKNYDVAVELMDSAVNYLGGNAAKAALPYIFTRALLKNSAGRYREAVFDYNIYEENAGAGLNADFYYLRSQAEVEGRMYQQALNDLEKALSIAPEEVALYLEKGILCYKVNLLDEAAEALECAKKLNDGISDVYYLLGCVYSKLGKIAIAEENLSQAVTMGHPDAPNKLAELKKQ